MGSPDLAQDLAVVTYPDPRLRTVSVDAEPTDHTRAVAKAMHELMAVEGGIGLAAPQVGWNVRLFVMNPTGEPEDATALLNPKIVAQLGKATADEGCLSLPGVSGKVSRARQVVVRALDLDGNEVEIEADGIAARCIQHEMDHLEGILIIDKFGPAKRMSIRGRLKELESGFEGGEDESS